MIRLVLAALVLLLSIGSLLGAAAWNRGGDPQFLVLTERELALPWSFEHGSDDQGAELRLSFRWQRREDPLEARVWLTDIKLRELGLSTGLPAGAPEAELVYGRSLPRKAWVVFEYDGPAWRLIDQRRLMASGPRHGAAPLTASRLVPIDIGAVPDTLQRRHAGEPVIVLPAILQMHYERDRSLGPSVWGVVQRLALNDVSVPLHLRERLRGLPPQPASPGPGKEGEPVAEPPPPRYEVRLGVGRLGAVWIQDLWLKNR